MGGSTRELTSPVVMNPVTVDLVGTVTDSSGGAPNQLNPYGIPDTVTVVETGQTANIINGAYTIPDVPVIGNGMTIQGYTLQVSAYNPNAVGSGGTLGVQEQGSAQNIKPISDGSANPTFVVPTIRTTP